MPTPIDRVLDFGCGVGRTFPFLKTIARHVTGFDLPPMIERCRVLAPEPADDFLDDWDTARDFGTNVFADAAATGMFEAGECVEVDHDPATHQLRVLGRTPFHAARAADARGHYEVLLRSRI